MFSGDAFSVKVSLTVIKATLEKTGEQPSEVTTHLSFLPCHELSAMPLNTLPVCPGSFFHPKPLPLSEYHWNRALPACVATRSTTGSPEPTVVSFG